MDYREKNDSISKKCVKCNLEKKLVDFTKSKTSKDGYRNTCKNCTNLAKNNEKYKLKQKEYRIKNRNKKLIYMSIYNSKKENKERVKNWHIENKDRVNELKRYNRKYITPHVEVWRRLLTRVLYKFDKPKEGHTIDLLGYSALNLKEHIASLFTDNMSWDNYGEWHIDHIIPVINFNKDELPSVVNALSNLRPMWATTREINGVVYLGNLNRPRYL